MLPAWAFKQRKTASAVINLYINPESMFFAFEVKRLLKYCPEYMAEEERARSAVVEGENLERPKGVKSKVRGGG